MATKSKKAAKPNKKVETGKPAVKSTVSPKKVVADNKKKSNEKVSKTIVEPIALKTKTQTKTVAKKSDSKEIKINSNTKIVDKKSSKKPAATTTKTTVSNSTPKKVAVEKTVIASKKNTVQPVAETAKSKSKNKIEIVAEVKNKNEKNTKSSEKEIPTKKNDKVEKEKVKPTKKAVEEKHEVNIKKTTQKAASKPEPPKAPAPSSRGVATPAVRSTEKKPQIVIAHRRMDRHSAKQEEEAGKVMISYLPETYRSILDTPEQLQGPAYRYSDEELIEFKNIIISRLESARKELTYLQGLITRKDEAGTEDTENRFMNMEDGSGAMEREQLAQLASRQIQFISHLEKAMVRIENKTYGICRVTGKLIEKARLRAVPHATLSMEAKKSMPPKQG